MSEEKKLPDEKREDINRLYELAKPLVIFLREKYSPHNSIVITDNSAKVICTQESIPFHY